MREDDEEETGGGDEEDKADNDADDEEEVEVDGLSRSILRHEDDDPTSPPLLMDSCDIEFGDIGMFLLLMRWWELDDMGDNVSGPVLPCKSEKDPSDP